MPSIRKAQSAASLEGGQSAVKLLPPAIVQIMLTTADSAQLWPGRNT
jgi:hypothetical protein